MKRQIIAVVLGSLFALPAFANAETDYPPQAATALPAKTVAQVRDELIAARQSVEEIRRFLGADSLGYLSLESLRAAVGDTEGKFCTACYTASYPTETVQLEVEAHREG